jgi:membrane protein
VKGLRGRLFAAFDRHGLSWPELGRCLYEEANEDNALGLAAQLAFYLVLSVFPFLIFLLTLIAYLPIPDLERRTLGYLGTLVPGQAARLLSDIALSVVARQQGRLLTVSFLGALWSASSALGTFIGVMDLAYDVPETRSWLRRKALAVGLTLLLAALMIAAAVLLAVGPGLVSRLAGEAGLSEVAQTAWLVLKWPAVVVLVALTFGLLYYLTPDTRQRWSWITPGSALATLLWIVLSLGFAFYVSNFGAYNKVYGFIGAVVVLMLWFWLSALAAIAGAELNAVLDEAGR